MCGCPLLVYCGASGGPCKSVTAEKAKSGRVSGGRPSKGWADEQVVGGRVSGGPCKQGAVHAGRGPGKRVFSLRSRVARNVPAVGVPPGLPCDIASAVPVFVDAGSLVPITVSMHHRGASTNYVSAVPRRPSNRLQHRRMKRTGEHPKPLSRARKPPTPGPPPTM